MRLLIRLLSATAILSLIGIGAGFWAGTWQGEFTAALLAPLLFASTVLLGLMQLLQVRKIGR
jgi:hypothetical protein